jgi:hypothetical protein
VGHSWCAEQRIRRQSTLVFLEDLSKLNILAIAPVIIPCKWHDASIFVIGSDYSGETRRVVARCWGGGSE